MPMTSYYRFCLFIIRPVAVAFVAAVCARKGFKFVLVFDPAMKPYEGWECRVGAGFIGYGHTPRAAAVDALRQILFDEPIPEHD